MWFMPYMRVRTAVLIYTYIVVGISLVAIALRFWPGAAHFDAAKNGGTIDISMLTGGAIALAGGLATVFGLNLAAENDGHLELAWTKPISREGYALSVFAVDIGALIVCILITVVCAAVVCDVYVGFAALRIGTAPDWLQALAFCGWPLCVYAWICAMSASLKRNRGAVAGLFWPLFIVIAALANIAYSPIHAIAAALNLFNPIVLFSVNGSSPHSNIGTLYWGWGVAVLLLIAAMLQWRRLQA